MSTLTVIQLSESPSTCNASKNSCATHVKSTLFLYRTQEPSVHMLPRWCIPRQQVPQKNKTEETINQRVQKTGGLLFGKNVCQTLPINRKGRSDIYLHSHKPLTWTGRVQVPPTASVCPKGNPGEICTRSNTRENHGWCVSIMRLECTCVFDIW